jgi:flavin-binding protein dodecin
MSNHVYKVIEIVGTSESGSDDAIKNAITEAAKTVQHIDWYELVRQSGHVVDGKVDHFQATLKIGFRLNR